MATNVDAPSGLKPVRYLNGSAYDGKHNLYLISTAVTTATYVGDIVTAAAVGGAAGVTVNGIDCTAMPTLLNGAAGDVDIVGVVVGFLPDPTSLGTKHRAASTNRIALVADAPDLIFEIQEDANGGVDIVNANADVVVGTGSTTTGMSAAELNSTTVATTTAQLRILRAVPRPDNDPASANAKWEVVINEHAYKQTAGS